ncbi:MAG: preprotein translocase subunit SecA [Clostridiaceae bacterium]|nr:preprotein translocase subunit SecA [Clostridiaceae bacterium]
MAGFFAKLFGTHSDHEIKRIEPVVRKVEALADEYKRKTDAELREKTAELKSRYQKGESLDEILPEAFANVREGAFRVLGETPFHVQLIGGVVLHQGRIAEMKTGEGKTLAATLPAYLNALTGEGVHIVTVNDYLARHGSEWMGKIYRFLGLSVGLIVHDLTNEQRRAAYACDITYGTNNELGFDYLRDNMAIYKKDMVQRGHAFAIVDEVDSILIDEARTPLIISGQAEESSPLYGQADAFAVTCKALRLKEEDVKQEQDDIDADYIVDEKARTATLTPQGVRHAEERFGVENLMDPENTTLVHHINQAIKARGVMQLDVDYVVRDNQVIIVDEFTGRLMYGRRYSEGLHQAIEAKEKVKVENESRTLATITFQNFFRLYKKLSGMTGTALTEEQEFRAIYNLDVVEIPTNKPVARIDYPDTVYRTKAAKYRAVVEQVKDCVSRGQPIMVGTVSIEVSELVSALLKKEGVKHEVLNAKHHEKEAQIVAQAGKFGAVTIATNMAGRGTDIKLGGNPDYIAENELYKRGYTEEVITEATGFAETEDPVILEARAVYKELVGQYSAEVRENGGRVRAAGGLFILGTERHESRRIDNQLRGRSGRQGDPGASRFILSMEDDLMRLFGSERIQNMMENLGIDEDTPIDQKILTGAIENAQKKVESRNFESRKRVLEYDDVMNVQRQTIYSQRLKVLNGEDLKPVIAKMVDGIIDDAVAGIFGDAKRVTPDAILGIGKEWLYLFPAGTLEDSYLAELSREELCEKLHEAAAVRYAEKEAEIGENLMREAERVFLLQTVDRLWMEQLDAMQELRQGIGLRAYAQHDPVVEYKREGFEMFEAMIREIRETTVRILYNLRLRNKEEPQRKQVAKITTDTHGDGSDRPRPARHQAKPGRNDPCPCGSGKKYKKCCGRDE